MKWITKAVLPNKIDYISYESDMLSIGSCFADEVGERLSEAKFNIAVNPIGILFNPVSILQSLQNSLNSSINEDLILERDEHFFHYAYHSELTADSKPSLIENIRQKQDIVKDSLTNGNRLLLTFGTAWAYRKISDKKVVANCHKMSASLFEKELLDLEKLKVMASNLFESIIKINPNIEVLISISPVRHSKDGLHENNLSKGVLQLFTDFLCNKFDKINYFPAYELVIDELRDYRFYKEDLVHPNKQAVDYVFDAFKTAYFSNKTKDIYDLQSKIVKAKSHQFMNASEVEKKNHQQKIIQLEDALSKLKA